MQSVRSTISEPVVSEASGSDELTESARAMGTPGEPICRIGELLPQLVIRGNVVLYYTTIITDVARRTPEQIFARP